MLRKGDDQTIPKGAQWVMSQVGSLGEGAAPVSRFTAQQLDLITSEAGGSGSDAIDVLRGIGSRGVRNESILTAEQETQLYKHVDELGLDRADFRVSTHFSGYSDNFDVVFLGPNTFPGEVRTTAGVFESMSPRAVVAHEAGHLITTRAGTAFEAGSLYDEVGASLTGRQLPGLNNVERYQLLRDAVERSQLEGRSLRDVISEMQGN